MDALFDLISTGKVHNIIVMVGAGISVASGIPDFRSPQVGLYASIEDVAELHGKDPTFVFEIEVFEEDPKPFWWIFSQMWPKTASALPTPFHFFLNLLYKHNLLLRCYSQNIDGLEKLAGLPREKVIHAHGVLDTCRCIKCNKTFDLGYCLPTIHQNLMNDHPTIENAHFPKCDLCGSNFVKPDVVLFHEDLPDLFFDTFPKDFKEADLLIIAGTSLEVYPFASLPKKVNKDVKRFLINKTMIKNKRKFTFGDGRDYFIEGDCQDFAQKMSEFLGWEAALNDMIETRKSIGKHWNSNICFNNNNDKVLNDKNINEIHTEHLNNCEIKQERK
ncbi:NAD-dependent protein deacetylase sirtuin-2 [Tritrichomonas foetus]|uniref:NAD-dependent protein deacetylase sirtuin-2 n=1 Tax=Tritrichomonas foetus TaxID=1144522 RepID=A0A1J4KM93_9EUKA|nr:NAD-dependent protein deacetylase sirtuin-2 [Tritrichomonas foetus]|eukprot:OHT10814.1 NAD-dependent protein deacetylase sirtuin-2 [Tritrichomonas foetus]